jgi:hypothetical protein
MKHPCRIAVIVDRIVLYAAIVPEDEVTDAPVVPSSQLRSRRVLIEILEKGPTLVAGHVLEVSRKRPIPRSPSISSATST